MIEIYNSIPNNAKLCVFTGANGSGKTRILEKISKDVLLNIKDQTISFQRMVCLSGTVLDKFPDTKNNNEDIYAYFGRKTNNNMFSEISPFRTLILYMFDELLNSNMLTYNNSRIEHAVQVLNNIRFGPELTFYFRHARNSKEKLSDSEIGSIHINLIQKIDQSKKDNLLKHLTFLKEQKILLSDITFNKGIEFYGLMELSSGERAYILTLLSLCFAVKDRSIVLFDEPENSLHPKWQADIMKDIWDTVTKLSEGSLIIIATHSPLIVSGVVNDNAYILDLERNSEWIHADIYGNTSDIILKEQFDLISPRSFSVLSKIQKCLTTVINIENDPNTFQEAVRELQELNLKISIDDPLYPTIDEIKNIYESMS